MFCRLALWTTLVWVKDNEFFYNNIRKCSLADTNAVNAFELALNQVVLT